MMTGYSALIFAALAFTVLIGLFGVGIRVRQARSRRARLDEWCHGQGLRLASAHMLPPYFTPRELRGHDTLGAFFYRVKALGADGRTIAGYVRMPMFEGRFAPPIRAIWAPNGPDFGAESREGGS
jgi:hypothetical protein